MPQRLPPVLSPSDLPLPELLAARLDGELFRIDDCYAPVDEVEQPSHRALALAAGLPERLIAERRSAAWIWGALDRPPTRHELCVAIGARTRSPAGSRRQVREVVIESREIAVVGGLQVTVPLRTAVDLARFSTVFGAAEAHIVNWLMTHHGFTVADCLAEMDGRRNLPGKRQAAQRLARMS